MADIADHAERMLALIQEFEQLEEGPLRDRVFELLEHVDHLHRTCVWRVFELATELGGKGLVDRMTQDSAVKTLFMLYDLVPVDPLIPIEAQPARSPIPPTASGGGYIPLRSIGGRKPSWKLVFARTDLPDGALRAVEIDGTPVLLCGVGGQVYAYRNACGRSVLPLHVGILQGSEVNCPWHGCRYDATTGALISGHGRGLEAFAVSIRDDQVFVATNVPPQRAAIAAGEHG